MNSDEAQAEMMDDLRRENQIVPDISEEDRMVMELAEEDVYQELITNAQEYARGY